jgi:hypothetical protein
MQRRSALQEQKTWQVEAIMACGRIFLTHQLAQLFATNLYHGVAALHQDPAFVSMHLVDMRMERTKDVAVPASPVLRGEKLFQLLHKRLEKRAASCKEGTGEVTHLSFCKLIEILLANLDGYHEEPFVQGNISRLGSIRICK